MTQESVRYAELHCLSNFTFLRGASHPQELVARAIEQQYDAIAITDECSVAGVVRALLQAAEEWTKIVQKLGIDKQKAQYKNFLDGARKLGYKI